MRKTLVFGLFLVLFFMVNASAQEYCSINSYRDTCKNCPTGSRGEMQDSCVEKYKNEGVECLALSYPLMAIAHKGWGCPALDACINQLESCIAARCPGTNKQDCNSAYCQTCYSQGDHCAHMASFNCDEPAECGDGKCERDKGEGAETCCEDCKCPPDLRCKYNSCYGPDNVPKPEGGGEGVPPVTIPENIGDEGYSIFDLIWDICGMTGAFLMVLISLAAALVKIL